MERSEWSAGPWDDETIDKAVWVDSVTGLDCMLHRGPTGGWCGYVGVKKSHKLHGCSYNDCCLDAHGGLTFSSGCSGMSEDGRGICHPSDDEDHVWWLGFDAGHSGDITPHQRYQEFVELGDTYKTQTYMQNQVTNLAKQISEEPECHE